MTTGNDRLAATLRTIGRRLRQPAAQAPALHVDPSNPFEVAIAERIRALADQVNRLNTMLWWLFTVVVGFALLNIVLSVLK